GRRRHPRTRRSARRTRPRSVLPRRLGNRRARHSDRRPPSRRRDVLLPRNAWLGSCPCPNRRTERAHTAEHGRAAVTVAPVAWASVRPAACRRRAWVARLVAARSEEHTSELQSREKLVCRLLLEKKSRRAD